VKVDRDFVTSLGSGKSIAIRGELKYQACDEKICYVPTSVPAVGNCRLCLWISKDRLMRSSTVNTQKILST